MKRLVLCILLMMVTSGCSALKYPGFSYAMWKQDIRNDRNEQAYREAVAEHAGESELVGTWHRSVTLMTKKIFPPVRYRHLSLFKDETYTMRVKTTGLPTTIATHTGTWTRGSGGVILLDPEGEGKPFEVDLGIWTNDFVQANHRLNYSPGTAYETSILRGSDGLPIFVQHYPALPGPALAPELPCGIVSPSPAVTSTFVPSARLVVRADKMLLEQLKKKQPDRQYLRRYRGYRVSDTVSLYPRIQLRIQLIAKDTIASQDPLDHLGWANVMKKFDEANEPKVEASKGPETGDAIYDVELNRLTITLHEADPSPDPVFDKP